MFDEGFYAHNGVLDWYDSLGDDQGNGPATALDEKQ